MPGTLSLVPKAQLLRLLSCTLGTLSLMREVHPLRSSVSFSTSTGQSSTASLAPLRMTTHCASMEEGDGQPLLRAMWRRCAASPSIEVCTERLLSGLKRFGVCTNLCLAHFSQCTLAALCSLCASLGQNLKNTSSCYALMAAAGRRSPNYTRCGASRACQLACLPRRRSCAPLHPRLPMSREVLCE